jgi:ribosomal protein S14
MKCEHCGIRKAMRDWIICRHCSRIFFPDSLALPGDGCL